MPIDWTPEELEAEQAAMRKRNTFYQVYDGSTIDRLMKTVEESLTKNSELLERLAAIPAANPPRDGCVHDPLGQLSYCPDCGCDDAYDAWRDRQLEKEVEPEDEHERRTR